MEQLSVVKNTYIQYIDQVIQNHKVSHAYLIEIDSYEEDLVYVESFIKMILCNVSYEELEHCENPILSLIDHHNYPDIQYIEPDGNTIKKSQLLDLQKEYSNQSLMGGKRIYIIHHAEKMNAASANTMLKFLEEPDEDIIAFLITENRYHLLETILSRCQILSLKEENLSISVEDDLLELLKVVLFPKDFFLKYRYFIENVIVDKTDALLKFKKIEDIIICYLHQKNGMSSELESSFSLVIEKCSQEKILTVLSILEEELPKLEYNVNYKLWLDSLFSKIIIGG